MALSNVRVDDLDSLNLEPAWDEFDDANQLRTTAERRLGNVTIGGCSMHVEAIEVAYGEDGQEAVVPELDDALAHIRNGVGAEGNFHTVEIEGREYVLIITPFCT